MRPPRPTRRRRPWPRGRTSLLVCAVGLGTCTGSEAPSSTRLDAQGRPAPGVRVRGEVLNAGDVRGAARLATDVLRDAGFDVVFYGNATESRGDSSTVVDRVGDPATARAVADALGIGNVRSQPDPNLYLEASVLLGSEWVDPRVVPGVDAAAGARAWWDPRGWFER